MDEREQIIQTLLRLPNARLVSADREIAAFCPFCGDSPNPNSRHFYIKIDGLEDSIPPLFHCKLCDIRGVLNSSHLLDFGIYDFDTATSLKKIIATSKRLGYNFSSNKKENFVVPHLLEKYRQFTQKKLDYINNRLGTQLTFDDAHKFKIIFNLYDSLDFNRVSKLSASKKVTDILDKDFVGFLSLNNEFVNLRNMYYKKNDLNKRYYNYNIFNKYDNTKKMYVLPTSIDITRKVKLVMAEGAFDILGIYHNVYNCEEYNIIYVAVCGGSYTSTILHFIKEGILNMEIEIYSDNEKSKSIYHYQKMKQKLSDYLYDIPVTIFYNSIGKDFGVQRNQIQLTSRRI